MVLMVPIDELPIPDWGLKCPKCGAALAGAVSHQCSICGELFNVRQLLSLHRPIPDLGLECPNCGYSLTGLPDSRCPECGMAFSLRILLGEEERADGIVAAADWADPPDCHIPKRAPAFTGNERPFPNFGLMCIQCERPLAGATDDRCPSCGQRFELTDFTGKRDWVLLTNHVPRSLAPSIRGVLYDNEVPYLLDNARLRVMYGDLFARGGIRVPREYFFDALYAIEQTRQPPPEYASKPWECPSCGEKVPSGFEVCWNCGRPHPLIDQSACIEGEEQQ